ncbi:MAG TPA: YbgF trimerization domain-containing protein, partial [Syntrophales bacterium]|nr:YbgF trimerization domain-containing protein [Syntrophales bacterium]
LDSKIAALEKDVTASRDGVADLRDRLDKLEDTVKSIQRFQADTGADMTALRAEIQRLRGATEETRES